MKISVLSVLALLVGLPALGGTAMAAELKYKPAAKMKLSSNFPIRSSEPIPVFDPVSRAFETWKGTEVKLRAAHTEMRAKEQQCRNAEYSRAEQTAVGCQATDSVATCERKLFDHCSVHTYNRYRLLLDEYTRTRFLLIKEIDKHMNRVVLFR